MLDCFRCGKFRALESNGALGCATFEIHPEEGTSPRCRTIASGLMEPPQGTHADVGGVGPGSGRAAGVAGRATAAEVGGSTRLILFFVPPSKDITGGLLSIFSIAATTRSLFDLHRASVQLCVYPGYPSYGRNDLFDNDEEVRTIDEVVNDGVPAYLQLHIPVDASDAILDELEQYKAYLDAVPDLTVNLLNQNILLMPEPSAAARWFALTPVVTQTTAHDRYATQEVADLYNIPLYHLSAYLDPGQYEKRPYAEKSNTIVLSPDVNPEKEKVVARLMHGLPDYEMITVGGMSYKQYKDLIAGAKFCITFGEGFDGYFLEPCFSGSVSFAVYNEDFFPHREFADFANVYRSYDEMAQHVVDDIRALDAEGPYRALRDQNFAELAKFYDHPTYVDNVRKFLRGEVTFLPSPGSAPRLIGRIAREFAAEKVRHSASETSFAGRLEEMRRSSDQQAEELRLLSERHEDDLLAAAGLRTEVEELRTSLTTLESTRIMRYARPCRNIYARVRKHLLR